MPKQIIQVPILSEAMSFAPLSLAVRAGDYLYISGMPPFSCETGELVHGDIRVQMAEALRSLDACLVAGGATRADVVNVRIYCANSAWFTVINEVYAAFFGSEFPTRTFVPVASWPAEFDLEIDCVAFLGSSPAGSRSGESG
jgi:reactive intermediate/imine deaminase